MITYFVSAHHHKIIAKTIMSRPLLFLILFISIGVIFEFTHGHGQDVGKKTWCVANPGASKQAFQEAIRWACDQLANCSIIQPGGACFYPNNRQNHASVVMNMFYQKAGRHPWDCYFQGTGLVTTNDPSYGSCQYEFIP